MLVFLIGLFCYHFFYFLPGLKKKKSKAIYQVMATNPPASANNLKQLAERYDHNASQLKTSKLIFKQLQKVGGDIPKKKKSKKSTLEEEDNTQCSSDRVKKKRGRKEKKLELRTNLTANNDDECSTQKNRNGSDRSSKKSRSEKELFDEPNIQTPLLLSHESPSSVKNDPENDSDANSVTANPKRHRGPTSTDRRHQHAHNLTDDEQDMMMLQDPRQRLMNTQQGMPQPQYGPGMGPGHTPSQAQPYPSQAQGYQQQQQQAHQTPTTQPSYLSPTGRQLPQRKDHKEQKLWKQFKF
ncbi:hypothetical protein WR25_01545 [Diploscapter pachys]|uniref:Uncharacterized protein n=1 Tax=Diploscapter pachys TaxID=2018661 RepID=A0A2A2K5P3_9BILA|nr:hypothetical protein WR25_01545 [Diploscapter pachys]